MANLKQSKKRMKQDVYRRFLNKMRMSILRTSIKKFLKFISLNNFELADKNFSSVVSRIDKSVTKGIIKKNKANRLKSRLNITSNTI